MSRALLVKVAVLRWDLHVCRYCACSCVEEMRALSAGCQICTDGLGSGVVQKLVMGVVVEIAGVQ